MKCIKLKQLKLAPAPKVIAKIFAQFARFSVSSVIVSTNTSAADCWKIFESKIFAGLRDLDQLYKGF